MAMAEEAQPGADPETAKLLQGAAELEADGAQVRKEMADQELRQRAARESEKAQRVPTGTLDSGATDFVAPVWLEKLPGESDIQYVLRKRKADGFDFNRRAGRADVATLSVGASNAAWQTHVNPAGEALPGAEDAVVARITTARGTSISHCLILGPILRSR
ncbi:hypothetical protein LTS10_010211 [Elasticomyces elasticus]|nr:hypothetical protein LTS10_010211 [Elasticomyces elasticus]